MIIVGFAEDVIEAATADCTEILETKVNDTLGRIKNLLIGKGLKMAVNKTEAMIVTERRSYRIPFFQIGTENAKKVSATLGWK